MASAPSAKPVRAASASSAAAHDHGHDHHHHAHAAGQVHGPGCGHTSLSFEQLVEAVRGGGLRMTEARRAILRTLLEARVPLTLEEIRARATQGEVAPDFATVFRTMEKLEELHLVHRVNLERSSSYYELLDPTSHHDHLVCLGCGLVKPLTDECPVEKMEAALAAKHGFTQIRHSLEFFGKCPDCTRKEAEK